MNAVIQSLMNTKPLIVYFYKKMFVDDLKGNLKEGENIDKCKDTITYQLYCLYRAMLIDNCIVRPVKFKDIVGEQNKKFSRFSQECSEELLRFILDKINTETKCNVNVFDNWIYCVNLRANQLEIFLNSTGSIN
jgi:ubiquitin C-terminal hydrolase